MLLSIEKPKRSLRVYLPFEDLKVHPGDPLEIPVLIYNLSTQTRKITLNLESIFPQQINGGTSFEDARVQWFDLETLEQETLKSVTLGAGDSERALFCCHPPQQPQTLSQLYEFTIAVQDQGNNSDSAIGRIEMLPYGVVEFECPNRHQTIPSKWQWRRGWQQRTATYDLNFKNASNIAHTIDLTIKEPDQNAISWSFGQNSGA